MRYNKEVDDKLETARPPASQAEKRSYALDPALFSHARTEIVAGLIGMAILQPDKKDVIAERISSLIDQASQVDRMTGFKNRAGLLMDLEIAMRVARQTNTPLSVLFIDGDKFKEVNDELSHLVGDKLIIAFANGIRRVLKRQIDIVAHLENQEENQDKNGLEQEHSEARPGGDEFAVLLPGTPEEGAIKVAQELGEVMSGIADEEVPLYREHFGHPPTATIGTASFNPKEDHDAESLLKRADEDMQQKKRHNGTARR